jgi:predicted aldo/keto reductase-like oxidoreductase
MTALKRRLEKLEKFSPKIKSLSHLTEEELRKQLEEVEKRIAESHCSNCKGCNAQRECKELMDKGNEISARMGFIQNTV